MKIGVSTLKGVLCKALKKYEGQIDLEPGEYTLDQQILVTIKGDMTKIVDDEATPTIKVPQLAVMAMLLRRMGATREAALKHLRECLKEAMDSGDKMSAVIAADVAEFEKAIEDVRKNVLEGQPKIPRKGRVMASELVVTVANIIPQEGEEVA